jgi:hypothetical protein
VIGHKSTRYAFAAALALVVLIGMVVLGYRQSASKATLNPPTTPGDDLVTGAQAEPPAPTPPPEPVPALPVVPTRPEPALPGAVAVMIENSSYSWPQAGIEKADLVYEMESEFGITRFLAFFYQDAVERIGPVRSARIGYYDVATAYGVPYAHVGGSYEALRELGQNNRALLDLDEIRTCGDCFWRSRERAAPHNVYTSTALLIGRSQAVGWRLAPLHLFPEGGPIADGKPVSAINLHWGPKSQTVGWVYNGERYERSQSGLPHVTESGSTVKADTVVVLFTTYVWDAAAPPEGLNIISIIGSGSGYLFRDGEAYPVRWTKGSREQHYTITAQDGSPAVMAVGQTWVEILKSPEHLTTDGAL